MKIKYPTKRLVLRCAEKIKGWRAAGASWKSISTELESDSAWRAEGRKAILPNSVQKAWASLPVKITGNHMKSYDNSPASPASLESQVSASPSVIEKPADHEKLGKTVKSYDKPALTPVVRPSFTPIERLSEHETATRAALMRGNRSDADLGLN